MTAAAGRALIAPMADLILRQPPRRAWGTPNMSPFCGKLETYLRATSTPYQVAPANLPGALCGKIPYVELDGEVLTDSQLIIDELERRAAAPLDAGLTDGERALARVARRTLEEGTYFLSVRMRWVEPDGWPVVAAEMKAVLPAPLRLALPIIRRKVRKMTVAQGTGRRSRDEAAAMIADDWAAIATLLGERPFLLGDTLRTVDCTIYAFLEGILGFPVDSGHRRAVAAHANLVAYRQRVRDRWWSDLGPIP
ncbi:MAG: glutathione S-transferase family protein [Myxococcales bacterium]|nr:glutathione S-transferase family protein [Myxococcales bacterium]